MSLTKQPDRESDAALLACFAAVRDERAFAELMRRHSPMVFAAALRIVKQRPDAEDVLQAVFVTLAAKARSLRRVRSLAGWLHNVAVRVGLNVLKMNQRRERRMRELHERRPSRSAQVNGLSGLTELLDEELERLPVRLKEVVILRDLEGCTRMEAARRLGVPPGTIDSRLARGRQRLRERLVRLEVRVGVGGLAFACERLAEAAPQVPAELLRRSARHAELFLAGKSAGGLPAAEKIRTLAQGVMHTMFLSKLSTTVSVVAVMAALVLGAAPASQTLGLASSAQGATYFFDDFEDGDETDGVPATWLRGDNTNGASGVVAGDYILTGTDVSSYVEESTAFDDGYVRVQLRFLQSINSTFAYIGARSPIGAAYVGGIQQDGALAIIEANEGTPIQIHASINTSLSPSTRDVLLQFDTVGTRISLTAWHLGDPKPAQPQLVVFDDTTTSGEVGVGLGNGGGASQVAFRHVEAVPEPPAMALGSLGALALVGFALRAHIAHSTR